MGGLLNATLGIGQFAWVMFLWKSSWYLWGKFDASRMVFDSFVDDLDYWITVTMEI